MFRLWATIILVSATCAKLDYQNGACWAACRFEGFDGGRAAGNKWCVCLTNYKLEDLVGSLKVKVPLPHVKESVPSYYGSDE